MINCGCGTTDIPISEMTHGAAPLTEQRRGAADRAIGVSGQDAVDKAVRFSQADGCPHGSVSGASALGAGIQRR